MDSKPISEASKKKFLWRNERKYEIIKLISWKNTAHTNTHEKKKLQTFLFVFILQFEAQFEREHTFNRIKKREFLEQNLLGHELFEIIIYKF